MCLLSEALHVLGFLPQRLEPHEFGLQVLDLVAEIFCNAGHPRDGESFIGSVSYIRSDRFQFIPTHFDLSFRILGW